MIHKTLKSAQLTVRQYEEMGGVGETVEEMEEEENEEQNEEEEGGNRKRRQEVKVSNAMRQMFFTPSAAKKPKVDPDSPVQ